MKRDARVQAAVDELLDRVYDMWLGLLDENDPSTDERERYLQVRLAISELNERLYDTIEEVDRDLIDGKFVR